MKISKRIWYCITVIAFPLFFVLHGVNEQFGLIDNSTIAKLLLYYILVSVTIAVLSKIFLKEYERATVFLFVLLCIFFLFGAVKDSVKETFLQSFIGSYKIIIPVIFLIICISFLVLLKTKASFIRADVFIRMLLVICLFLETATLFYNVFTNNDKQRDLGDIDHDLIKNIQVSDSSRKPFIFWIVMDEYSGNTALKKRWNFNNPLDSILRMKGFFSADSARSPYNYTHYSLASTLDMNYLPNLKEHSVIGFRDIVRGNISLRETNVVKMLKMLGYNIHNYTIYNIDDHPTKAHEYFVNADFKLIDNQTLAGRIRQDIGWNFMNVDYARGLADEYKYRHTLMQEGLEEAKTSVNDKNPSFFMLHYMLTHEPFLYKADGSLDPTAGFGMAPEKYISSISYANNALTGFIDSLKSIYSGRELVIILQGDHGYKFDETDPLFDQEGCSILYAVYCSDSSYPGLNNSFNSVNGFRVIFNKYFHTNLPILENRSFNLYYR